MKKLSFIAALTLSTMLSACGGGGGGHSFIPPTTLPDNPEIPQQTVCANGSITCMMQTTDKNTNKRNEMVQEAEEQTPAQARFRMRRAAASRNNSDATQAAFDNMKQFLIDENLDNVSYTDLHKALILAGYDSAKLPKDNLEDWVRIHQNEIHNKAQRVWDMYGKEKNIGIDNARLTMVNFYDKQDSFVSFELDDKGDIIKLHYDVDTDSAASRRGDFNTKGNGEFSRTSPNWVYGIKTGEPGVDDLYLELWENLAHTDANLEKLKNMFRADLEYNKAKMSQKTIDNFNSAINALSWDDFGASEDDATPWTSYASGGDDAETIVTYKSYAKELDDKHGLKFADFGVMTVKGMETETLEVNEAFVFAGGYDAKKQEKEKLSGKMSFDGKAVAAVTRQFDKGGDERDEIYRIYDGQAKLDFDNGKETLAVTDFHNTVSYDENSEIKNKSGFDDWYDVTVTGQNGKYDIMLDDQGKKIDDNYRFAEKNKTQSDFIGDKGADRHVTGGTYGAADFGYYGNDVNDKDMEAAGYFAYGEAKDNGDFHAQISFGAKRTE